MPVGATVTDVGAVVVTGTPEFTGTAAGAVATVPLLTGTAAGEFETVVVPVGLTATPPFVVAAPPFTVAPEFTAAPLATVPPLAAATVVPLDELFPEGMGPPQTPKPKRRAITVRRQQRSNRPTMHPVLQQSFFLTLS